LKYAPELLKEKEATKVAPEEGEKPQ